MKKVEPKQEPIEEKPIELEGIIKEYDEIFNHNPDRFYDSLKDFIQSTYLLGVKAGKREATKIINDLQCESELNPMLTVRGELTDYNNGYAKCIQEISTKLNLTPTDLN